jgi:hypothetical protein
MDWQTLKESIYDWDGAWRDIYVDNTTIEDWRKWVDYVNANYRISWRIFEEESNRDKIDFDMVLKCWAGEREYWSTATVYVGNYSVNAHFFLVEQIENDIDPREITSIEDHNLLVNYLKDISGILNKKVKLTIENCPEIVLITVDKDTVNINADKESQGLTSISE